MRIIPAFLAAFLLFILGVQAGPLDGLWRSDRQNILLRIEQDGDGFRAKRMDQGVWYRYILKDDYLYIDRYGNTYEIRDQHEIEWREAATGKRIYFTRTDQRNALPDPRRHNQRVNVDDRNVLREAPLAGRWHNKRNKERLLIEATRNGYRVRTQHGPWEKFAISRNGRQIQSRSGDIIQLIDRNTITWRNRDERRVHTFIRQGNGHAYRKNEGFQKHNDKRKGKHHPSRRQKH